MSRSPYSTVLRRPGAVTVLLLGLLARTPIAAAGPLITLHVVKGLGHSYTAAGIVVTVNTVAAAIASPWRGHLVDKQGLRRTLATSIVLTFLVNLVAPFSDYLLFLVLAGVAGLVAAPVWSLLRQALLAAVPVSERRSALSLDSITTEVSFMVGPLVSLWLGVLYPTRYVLLGVWMVGVAALCVLWVANPAVVGEHEEGADGPAPTRREWMTPRLVAVLLVAGAAHVILVGGDMALMAAMRSWDRLAWLGTVYVFWCAGSIVGALVYGAMHRHISPFFMLGLLGVVSLPMALATDAVQLGGLAFIAGLACAPTLTATVEAVGELVPVRARGEAMGWHGSFLTVGAALGAPFCGWFIDHFGFRGGILAGSLAGLAVAVAGAFLAARFRARRVRTGAASAPGPAVPTEVTVPMAAGLPVGAADGTPEDPPVVV